MIGRLIGLIFGLAIAAVGYGMWKPVEFAKYVPPKYLDLSHVPLGPFAPYNTLVYGLIFILGVVVALASLQRQGRSRSLRPAPTVLMGSEGDHAAPAHDAFSLGHDDGHGHGDSHGDAHGHDDHGHDAHGHDDHGHDAHGHDDHGHDDHGHNAHGHDAHGHDDHGHDAHGHAPAHH